MEALTIAEAIQENLQYECNVELWSQGVFNPSSTTLEDLLATLRRNDFAIFIFSPDDITILRNKAYTTVRDNVILELGMSIGIIGKERTFYVTPLDSEVHLPTDLLGFNPAKYDPTHPNIIAATGITCTTIKRRIRELGKRVL